jgi:hypothetical protein
VPAVRARAENSLFVERRQDVRIVVSVPGSYELVDRESGERHSHPCRAVNISTRAIALTAPVSGRLGQRVIATIEQLGQFQGPIMRLLDGGFVMSIVMKDADRRTLNAKIAWLDRFKNFDVSEQRIDNRFIPADPNSRLIFADGSVEDCFILDLSRSGAAVAAQAVPDIGTVLALSSLVGRVVRHFDGGFAMQFVERQSEQEVQVKARFEPRLVYKADLKAQPAG